MIYGAIVIRIKHPTLAKKASVKLYSNSDMVHMTLKLEYVLPLLSNPKTYYLLHCFQNCLRVALALLVLGGHIIDKQFLAMWVVEDLEWNGILAYLERWK